MAINELEIDELKEEVKRKNIELNLAERKVDEKELQIEDLEDGLERKNIELQILKVFIRDCILIRQEQLLEAYWREHNISEEERRAIELQDQGIVIVLGTKKSYEALPTACSESLATYSYLVFGGVYFDVVLHANINPDLIPYVHYGPYIARSHEGGLIQALKENRVVNLDYGLNHDMLQDLEVGTKLHGWLADVLSYEMNRQQLIQIDEKIKMYKKAYLAYEGLSILLAKKTFFFGNRPTSLDALFIGHALFVLSLQPRGSVLQDMLLGYQNLAMHANNHGQEILSVGPASLSENLAWTPPKEFKFYQLCYFTHNFKQELKIGEGSFGQVYKGWIWGFNNPVIEGMQVAVKVSTDKKSARLEQWNAEVQCGSMLRHKNIIKVLGHYKDEEKLYIVYEYMQNGTLGQHYEGLDWPDTIRIARGIALAVELMHEQIPALINRDLKLNNILLDEDFNPKVSDLGLVTEEGRVCFGGTPGYTDNRSLEKGIGTKQTDMHNLGVILLQLITKEPYIDKQVPISKKVREQFKEEKIVFHEALRDTGCEEETARIIIKMALLCLDENLDKRPNIGQVVKKLHEL